MIYDEGGVGVWQGSGVFYYFGKNQQSLFRTDTQGPIRDNGSQGSTRGPQASIWEFFNFLIDMITNRLWLRPYTTIFSVTISNKMNILGLSLTHPDAITHGNNETHRSFSKILRAKLLKWMKALKLNNLPPKTLWTFNRYRPYCPGIIIILYRKKNGTRTM